MKGDGCMEWETYYQDNWLIRDKANEFYHDMSYENLAGLMAAIAQCMLKGGSVPTPLLDINQVLASQGKTEFEELDDYYKLKGEMNLEPALIRDNKGRWWMPLFTDFFEIDKGPKSAIHALHDDTEIYDLLEITMNEEDISGIVINPYDNGVTLDKKAVQLLLDDYAKSRN